MKSLWKQFDELVGCCYKDMLSQMQDEALWNRTFQVLLAAVQEEQKEEISVPELSELEEKLDYACDIEGWLEDYLDFLDVRNLHDDVLAVCEIMLGLFSWKKDSPSELKWRIVWAFMQKEEYGEAYEFGRTWYEEEPDNLTAATALVYGASRTGRDEEAEQILNAHMNENIVCTDENRSLFLAAEHFYQKTGNKKAAKWVRRAMDQHEKEFEEALKITDSDKGISFN